MSNLELNFSTAQREPIPVKQSAPPALTETRQPGLASGSYWSALSPAGQQRVIIATVREALAREITYNEIRQDGREPYRHVRIEENGAEYELNFAPEATQAQIMAEPLKNWRII